MNVNIEIVLLVVKPGKSFLSFVELFYSSLALLWAKQKQQNCEDIFSPENYFWLDNRDFAVHSEALKGG